MTSRKRSETHDRLVEELTGQFTSMGMEADAARAAARNEVGHWQADPDKDAVPPYLVLPHAQGWQVTRAFSVTEQEVFAGRDDAVRRARDLAGGEGCGVAVCNASGEVVERVEPGTPSRAPGRD